MAKNASKTDKLSLRDAAKITGLNYETIARYVRDGKLHAKKEKVHGFREEWRILRSDLERLEQEKRQGEQI